MPCICAYLKTDQAPLCAAAYQHDRRIRIYETENDWRLRKDVHARNLRWTVTDTCLSPDQRFLLYSSITPTVHMVSPFWQACSRVDTIGGSTHGPGLRRHQEQRKLFKALSLGTGKRRTGLHVGAEPIRIYESLPAMLSLHVNVTSVVAAPFLCGNGCVMTAMHTAG